MRRQRSKGSPRVDGQPIGAASSRQPLPGVGTVTTVGPSKEWPVSEQSTHRELPVSFSSFVVSMATSTMVSLGEGPTGAGAGEVNLELARNGIDLLGMLREKTEGNLDDDEQKLLETLLYELRTKFVEKSKSS